MSLRVLLVEDNPLNAELAIDLLEAEGHRIRHAASAASLREVLAAEAPADVLLMDVLLPDGDGVSLLSEVRAHARWDALPVVAFTAHALRNDVERYLAAGFAGVLTKPIDTRTFVAAVERFAGAARE